MNQNEEILDVLKRQLNSFWNVSISDDIWMLEKISDALTKVNNSFMAANNKYYLKYGFSIYNSAQYSIFLYYLANIIGNTQSGCNSNYSVESRGGDGGGGLADQIYYLNKIMNCVDWYWQVDLPNHFIVVHPIGTILGRAQYSDYLCVYQGVTIGGNFKQVEIQYPSLGNYVTLYANASVIGNSKIGNQVIISANAFVKDENIEDNSIVFGSSPHLIVKSYDSEILREYLRPIWGNFHSLDSTSNI